MSNDLSKICFDVHSSYLFIPISESGLGYVTPASENLSFLNSKEQRYIKGTVQWLRVEFLLLIQTFSLVILLTCY